MADPIANPNGPFGQAAQDKREWDQMKSRQQALQDHKDANKPVVEQGSYTTGSDYQGN
jgi:hypothetical protein